MKVQLLLAAFGVGILCVAPVMAAPAPTYEWLSAQAASAGSAAVETVLPRNVLPVTITKTPKATADISKYTKTYLIDLKKFNISKVGTDAVATSRGLNEALQDAKTVGANRIVFPKGIYLISETDPLVIDNENTVIDLNGATLQMNTNGLPDYTMVKIVNGAENLRLTNGTLRGDRDTHDYKTIKSTHEHCRLLTFRSGKDLEVDHLTITNAPGFAITTSVTGNNSRPELLAMIYYSVKIKDLESGTFSPTGEKVPDATKTRSSKPYDISKCGGQFEFGYTPGYMGFPFIKDRHYQVVFYDKDMQFLERRNVLQFRKVTVPSNAKFVGLEFNQSEVSPIPAHSGAANQGFCGRISNFKSPTDVYFHDNVISNNRALGLAFTGGQKWLIENNLWEGNGGQAPSYAIDFEDGWEMMQDVALRNNIFKNNAHDLVVVAGSELLFEGNQFEKTVYFYGRAYNYTVAKNRFIGGSVGYTTRSGVLRIHDNHYENTPALSMTFDGKGVADGFDREAGTSIQTPAITLENETLLNVKQLTGTYFKFIDSKLENVNLIAGKDTVLVDFQNNDLTNVSLFYEKTGPDVRVAIKNNKGTLREDGPGLERKKNVSTPRE